MQPEQYTLDGHPVKAVEVTVRTDDGACIRIRAGGGIAVAIVRAIAEYEEPSIPGTKEAGP